MLFVLSLAVPLHTPFDKDTLKELAGRLNVGMRFAPFSRQLPFNRCLEDGGFVALEIGLGALEAGDGFVETGELFFDLCYDSFFVGAVEEPAKLFGRDCHERFVCAYCRSAWMPRSSEMRAH